MKLVFLVTIQTNYHEKKDRRNLPRLWHQLAVDIRRQKYDVIRYRVNVSQRWCEKHALIGQAPFSQPTDLYIRKCIMGMLMDLWLERAGGNASWE